MKHNVGTSDRMLRALGALLLFTCAVMAPLPWALRVAGFGAMGGYLLFTALAGTCFGYSLMGRSTCAVPQR